MRYRNKKNGNTYRMLARGIDTTNGRNGTLVVVYCPDDNSHSIYVRDESEFFQKFDCISDEVQP